MGRPAYMVVRAGDDAPESPPGPRELMAYSIVTVLMLITLVAAALQFADWLVTPSACLTSSSHSSVSSRSPSVSPPAPHRYSARAKLAGSSSGCPCP